MPDVFKLQLSYLSPDTAQVRVEQSPGGSRAMTPPFDPVTVRALLQVLEKRDLRRCRLGDKELAALRALGVIQDDRPLRGAWARRGERGLKRSSALRRTS